MFKIIGFLMPIILHVFVIIRLFYVVMWAAWFNRVSTIQESWSIIFKRCEGI